MEYAIIIIAICQALHPILHEIRLMIEAIKGRR